MVVVFANRNGNVIVVEAIAHIAARIGSAVANELNLAVTNGEQVPTDWSGDIYLTMLSKEGKAMRWLACSMLPEEYAENIADRDCSWPEARTFFQLWSGCEDMMLDAMVGCAMERGSHHMSLHQPCLM